MVSGHRKKNTNFTQPASGDSTLHGCQSKWLLKLKVVFGQGERTFVVPISSQIAKSIMKPHAKVGWFTVLFPTNLKQVKHKPS